MSHFIAGELYRTDINGVILEDLTKYVTAGTVEYSAERSGSTPLIGRFTLDKADALDPLRDFVSPFLILDGHKPVRMGIYTVTLPSERHTYRRAEPTYELRDLTARMAAGGSREPYVIPTGTTIVDALTDLNGEVGLTRFDFPRSTRVTGYKRTNPPGMPFLEQANKLCEGFGWYPEWMGLDGKIVTKPQQLLSETTPITTLGSDAPADYLGTEPVVQVVPTDPSAVANIVVVTRDRGDGDILEAVRVNDDPGSETSTGRIGPRVYGGGPYEASDAETQADVDAIADRLFEQARSYERRVTLKVEPDTRLLGMWRTLDLDIETVAGANLRGRYWINGWLVGFTPKQALMQFTLNRMVRFDRGEDR
jgi:hypothetical protein